jgi:hypothetical protein
MEIVKTRRDGMTAQQFTATPIQWWEWLFLWLLPTKMVRDDEMTLHYKMWMGKMYILETFHTKLLDR